ncbi:MAG: hypothetical protein ACFFAN_06045 [Promethearchaeota archaeon]
MILSLDLMKLGIFTLIYIIIISVIAVKMIIISFRVNNKAMLYAGLSHIGLAMAWSGCAFCFISIVFFNVIAPIELYFLFHGIYIPIALFFWTITCLILLKIKLTIRKWLEIVLGIIFGIVLVIYIAIIFIDATLLGTYSNEIQVNYSPFYEIFLLYCTIHAISIGFWLAIQASKSVDQRVRLKSKFIFSSYSIYAVAAFLEITILYMDVIILARILMVFMSILFYGGFILPKWMEKLFLRNKEI